MVNLDLDNQIEEALKNVATKDVLAKPPINDDPTDIPSIDPTAKTEVKEGSNLEAKSKAVPIYDKIAMSTSYTTKDTKKTIDGKNTQQSIFNNFALYRFNGTPFLEAKEDSYDKIDFGDASIYENPTVSKIIEKCNSGSDKKQQSYKYEWSDFALCKYLGKIPNNHMITLRRFSFPIGDDIMNIKMPNKEGDLVPVPQPDVARAVTWMSEVTGNKLEEILKFDYIQIIDLYD